MSKVGHTLSRHLSGMQKIFFVVARLAVFQTVFYQITLSHANRLYSSIVHFVPLFTDCFFPEMDADQWLWVSGYFVYMYLRYLLLAMEF